MSDHAAFVQKGIPYLYFEATNWFVGEKGDPDAYLGYYETYRMDVGEDGMFMNTDYDTPEELIKNFPGRCEEHFSLYSKLLYLFVTELAALVLRS